MKYLLLVSHGDFSQGLKNSLSMFAANKLDDVIAIGLKKEESVDQLAARFSKQLDTLDKNADFLVLGDIIGGSPLTTICNVLAQHGLLESATILGGMNFPMALNAIMLKDSLRSADLVETVLSEAKSALKEFKPSIAADDDDEEEI
ncbi:PTS sugar transporter subunit IIA [Liquorilactobacillus sicerae]|uniref:PTS sugar transporter subunit IIA n=1 Tax=Liquorilactobacillus sicerae TaxID=1416943 RepID=UPI00248075A0|nr:PTS fructose transporter subunit IIA [Liquorilactobacillus sicerae]